jgi:1-deoxy-D-xylulose-5-phosphate synthase
MAAADEAELVHMTHTAALHDDGPIAVRYPRGNGTGVALPEVPQRLEIGKGRVVREGKTVAILSLGTRLAKRSRRPMRSRRAGFPPPSPICASPSRSTRTLIRKLLTSHEVAVTVEEGAVGGLGAHVLTMASDQGLIDAGLKLRTMRLPDGSRTRTSPRSNMTRPASTPSISSIPCSRRCATTKPSSPMGRVPEGPYRQEHR